MAWAKMIAAFAFILLAVVMACVVRAGPARRRATGGRSAAPDAEPGAAPPAEYPRTFVISGGHKFDFARLRGLMRARGWAERSADAAIADGAVGFVWVMADEHGGLDQRLYPVRCVVKSFLATNAAIADKWRLWAGVAKHSPAVARAHFPETWDLVACAAPPAEGPLILRPTGLGTASALGRNIWRVADAAGFAEAKESLTALLRAQPKKGRDPAAHVLVSRYVRHPLLVNIQGENRKFHARFYLLIRAGAAQHAAVFDQGRMFTAAAPYRDADYADAAVHDTHGASTPRPMYFPDDFPGDAAAFLAQARRVLVSAVAPLLAARPPPEAKAAYGVFGVDFLADAAPETPGPVPRAVVLEVNARPGNRPGGYDDDSPEHADRWGKFCAAYTDWVNREALSALLPA